MNYTLEIRTKVYSYFSSWVPRQVFVLHLLLHSVFFKSDLFQNNHNFKGHMTKTG